MNTQPQHRTRMFARVLGPFFTLIPVAGLARAAEMPQLLSEFTASAVWPWVTGAFILAGGIAIVAFHQIWRGLAAIVISVLGWLLVVRGLVLIAFPDVFASLADRMIGATAAWTAGFVVMALIGVYLTYVGWKPAPGRPQDNQLHIDIEFPNAA
ncbi:hypothetical protein [Mycolicibacterium vinylchloridicum]|uniref:hypothetical protein n=1 Tax=Mycolicibacterium vinylchloridicum TaxID=2736928 RepID=UPI0015CA12CF|nr:hypothetical protein [Mycolicibacterium vinylchloridicum]